VRFHQSPATFTVEELPLFAPSGRGNHLYLTVRRSGMSTPFLLRELQRRLHLKEEDLGCAGMKDRDAVSVQTLSLPRHAAPQAERVLRELGCEVLSAAQHPHKLRTGKLAGNRFSIRVELEGNHEKELLAEGCRRIEAGGLANAFGPQRFADGSAIEEGRRAFLGIRRPGAFRRSRFAVSVFQALLFNELLALRRARGLWPGPLPGDLMKRHDSGGEFVAGEVDEPLRSRVAQLEISPTGPMFGGKMAHPEGEAWRLECGILASHGLTPGSLAASRVPGARRFLRVPAAPIAITLEGETAHLSFDLPPGSYASVLLQELGVEVVRPERPDRR
jgi:tRNA pseudouridine13 synthase